MNVKLLRIEAPSVAAGADVEVQVWIEIDGVAECFQLHVEPNILPGWDASLVVAGEALRNRLRHDQLALHRICRLVGRDVHGQAVHLPQLIAA